MAWLIDTATDARIYLAERCLVGRAAQCWVRIDDRSVSKEHAVVFFDSQGWVVKDLGSRNGTWANGTRLQPGDGVSVGKGSSLQFGDVKTTLNTTEPPSVCVCNDSRKCWVAKGGVLILPDEEAPLASLYESSPGVWTLDLQGNEQALDDDDTFYVAGERYRLHIPSHDARMAHQSTVQSPDHLTLSLGDLRLLLEVSQDGESIVTRLQGRQHAVELPARSSHQVLLVLARKRIEDEAAGVAAGERGWVYSDELARMLGYDRERVNVDIHRVRQQFAAVGVLDASLVIERRPTSHQLRLGIQQVAVS